MAAPRVFISFDFDHNEDHKMLFAGQATNTKTPFVLQDWSSKETLAQSKWEEIIQAKMNRTNMCLVLVGRHMGSATGVVKEIAMAKASNVPVFGVYVDGADTSSTLPFGLPRNRVIAWTWDGVYKAINQMMTEGKNVA